MSLDFRPAQRKQRPESIVPMINVVFLLLIFFLMTSQIAPPDPFEIAPPTAAQDSPADPAPALLLSAEGEMAFEETRGAAAIKAFIAAQQQGGPAPQLRADKQTPAATVARLLKTLAEAGLASVDLVVEGS